MTRLALSASAFAMSGGTPVDATTLIHVDPVPAPGGDRAIIIVEPLEPSPHGYELATLALGLLRDALANASVLDPASALTYAFSVANHALVTENRLLPGGGRDHRDYIGATAIVLRGERATIARVPPTQFMMVQDGRLYAFPDLRSWRGDYSPATDPAEPDPLGWREGTPPALNQTISAPGDLIVVCSSPLARRLGRDEARWQEWLLSGNPELALEGLAREVVAHGLEEVALAVVALERGPLTVGGRRIWRDGAGRSLGEAIPVGARHKQPSEVGREGAFTVLSADGGRRPAARESLSASTGRLQGEPLAIVASNGALADGFAFSTPVIHRNQVGPGARRTPAAAAERMTSRPVTRDHEAGFRMTLTRMVEWLLPARATPIVTVAIRRQTRLAPGARSMRRYRHSAALPAEWRAQLPRGLDPLFSSRTLAVAFVGFLALSGSGFAVDQHRDQVARAESALVQVDVALQRLTTDPTAVDAALLAADDALARARNTGADAALLTPRQQEIERIRDQAWAITRLTGMSRLGGLPTALQEQPARLVVAGGEIYLIAGALYQLDVASGQLVLVLSPGTAVTGGTVGWLAEGAANGSDLVVTDGSAFYTRDAAGRWIARPVGVAAMGETRLAMPLAMFNNRFYALGEDGRIRQYALTEPGRAPRHWADAGRSPRDLAIGDDLYVLLGDGTIATFGQRALVARSAPTLSLPMVTPIAIVAGAASHGLYLLDPSSEIGPMRGRIVFIGESGEVRQFLPPMAVDRDAASAVALADARDLAVDEAAGVLYIVTGRDVWWAPLPPV